MVQNIGYRAVQSIIYEATFTGNTTINGSDGFDLYWKVENLDTGSHTVNVPLVIQGALFELNPVAGSLTIGGGINNFNNRTLQVYGNAGHTLTLNTAVNGSGGLTVEQNSIVLLNTAQGYTGDTVLNAGEVRLGASDRISDSSDLDINASSTFNLNNFNETVATMDNDGTLTLGTGQLIVNGGTAGWGGTMSASSGGSLVKKGSGTISITGNNSGMAAGSSLFLVGGTTGLNNNNAAGSATIYLGETFGADAATIDISTAGIDIGNDITVRSGSSGAKIIDNASGGAITFSGGVTLNTTARLTASSGETTTFSGGLFGTGGIIKQGEGTVSLTAASGYSGYTFVDEGILQIGSGGDITASSGIDLGSAVYNPGGGAGSANATLDMVSGAASLDRNIAVKGGSGTRTITSAGNNTISGTIFLEDDLAVASSSGTLTLSGAMNLSNVGNNDLAVSGSGNTTISGAISAATGASDINKSGSGTLTLSGNNSGGLFQVNIASGTVALNHVNALGSSYFDKVEFTGSGTLQANASISPANLGIRVANGQTATLDVSGANVLTIGTALANISGSGTFTKTGTGTLTLSGDSTFTGTFNQDAGVTDVQDNLDASVAVNVNGGRLNVGTGALVSDVTQNSGTVSGGGTINGNYVQNSGVLSPGNSPGTLFVAGDAAWNGGSYLWEINDLAGAAGSDPGWDLVDITGALTIGVGYTVNVDDLNALAGWDSEDNYSWLIASADGGISGFNNLGLNVGSFNQNLYGGTFALNQVGNDIYLDYTGAPLGGGGGPSAVPEPNALSLTMLAGLLAVSFRHHMKKARRAVLVPA